MGDIQVYGMAMIAPNSSVPANQEAAVEGTDFTAALVQVTIPDGSTSGVIPVSVTDNQESGPLKVFQFVLTSVTGGKDVLTNSGQVYVVREVILWSADCDFRNVCQ